MYFYDSPYVKKSLVFVTLYDEGRAVTPYIAQIDLQFMNLLPQSVAYWDSRPGPLYLVMYSICKRIHSNSFFQEKKNPHIKKIVA